MTLSHLSRAPRDARLKHQLQSPGLDQLNRGIGKVKESSITPAAGWPSVREQRLILENSASFRITLHTVGHGCPAGPTGHPTVGRPLS